MEIEIEQACIAIARKDDMIGNVYQCRGQAGARGHVHVIIALTEKMDGWAKYNGYTVLTVDPDGDVVGAGHFPFHFFEKRIAIAKCDGVDGIKLHIRPLP